MDYRKAPAQSMPIRVGAGIDRKARHIRCGQGMKVLVAWLADNGSDGVIDDMHGAAIRFQPDEKFGRVDDRISGRLIAHDACFRCAILLRHFVIEPAAKGRLRAFIQHYGIQRWG